MTDHPKSRDSHWVNVASACVACIPFGLIAASALFRLFLVLYGHPLTRLFIP